MSLFRRLFGKSEKPVDPIDLSLLEVDIHSHLIPGIDDGAKSMEDTMSMLHVFEDLGFRKVITTPHIMGDTYKNTPEIILGGLEKVRAEIKKAGLKLEIEAAAEYYLDDVFEELLARDEILTFGDRYLLFEMPFVGEPANLARATFNMQLQGYKPVLAHPERYAFWHRNFDKYEAIHDKGVLLQLNINSLSGHYGPEVKKMGERLIDAGLISLIGTDCHRMEHLVAMKELTSRMPSLHRVMGMELLNTSV